MDSSERGEFADVSVDLAGGDHLMDLVEESFDLALGFALNGFREERSGCLGNCVTIADEMDVFDRVAIDAQEHGDVVAAERIVTFGCAVRAFEGPEIARPLAVVKNDLLIKIC